MKALFLIVFMTPAFAFAADGHASVSGFFWRLAMFIVFVALMYKILKDRVKTTLSAGVAGVEKSISDAEKAYTNSEKELAEYAEKMSHMNEELERMKQNARATAEKEAAQMVLDAEKSAAKQKEFTKNMIEAETEKARNDVHNEIISLVVEKAEKAIAADTDKAKKQKFIGQSITEIGVN